MAGSGLNGPCSSLDGLGLGCFSDPCLCPGPARKHAQLSTAQQLSHSHRITSITRLVISIMFPEGLQDSGPNALSHPDVSVCVLHLQPLIPFFWKAFCGFFVGLSFFFFYMLNTVRLWNMMPGGRFSPLGSTGPVLLNYWWNTDVISASGSKCILLKKK